MYTFMTATEAKKKLFTIIDEAEQETSIVVTRKGIPMAVIMSFEIYEGWQETMEIMADPEFCKDLDEAIREMRTGKTIPLEEVKRKLKA